MYEIFLIQVAFSRSGQVEHDFEVLYSSTLNLKSQRTEKMKLISQGAYKHSKFAKMKLLL